jgi:acetate CoA/acetoacetate CoA-transferase alpha subunit
MMGNKVYRRNEIIGKFVDGQRIMIGGFATKGVPDKLIDALVESGAKNLSIISNDTGDPGVGQGKLVRSRQAVKYLCSHIGRNPEAGTLGLSGEMDVELCPQGTLAERIRCGGSGLGGVLTKTGVGTVMEDSAPKLEVDGESYLLAKPLRADIALVKAQKADTFGNLLYHGTSRNFNPLVAMAADLVIVEAEEIVPVGTIDPDYVMTPGVFVHMILAQDGK